MKEKYNIDVFNSTDEEILKVVKENDIELDGDVSRGRLIDNLWKLVRSQISGPAFLVNHPKFVSPLAKSHDDNEELTERFQVVIAGSELGNGYSEINDPVDQLERFLEQQNMRDSGDEEAQMLDIDFVEMLEYGMPPASGYGQSERIFWFLEDVSGREGTFFPQMRVEVENTTKKIYEGKVKFPKEEKEEE
jgi:lysyl-tRNA synthetase class 2